MQNILYFRFLDLVLFITKQLRKCGEETTDPSTNESRIKSCNNDSSDSTKANANKLIFVEFFGPSISNLSIADRSAVANLCAEYGASIGYFPVDELTLKYLTHTGRDAHQISVIEMYMKKVQMFRSSSETESKGRINYDSVIEIDLSEVQVTVSGPRKAKERISVDHVSRKFKQSLTAIYGVHCDRLAASITIDIGTDDFAEMFSSKVR